MSILTSDFVWNVVERDELVKQLADCLFFSEEKSERRELEAAAETLHRYAIAGTASISKRLLDATGKDFTITIPSNK